MSDISETAAREVETKHRNGSTTVAPCAAADEELDNPFQADGELRRKADYIITHSRISRTEIQIADPDSVGSVPAINKVEEPRKDQSFDSTERDAQLVASVSSPSHSERPVEVKVAASDQQATPSSAEKVKIKKKKRCVIQ